MVKKRLFFFLKIAISVIILYLIAKDLDFEALRENLSQFTLQLIVIMLITSAAKKSLQLLNWLSVLRLDAQYKPEWKEVIYSFFIGESLRFLIPGGYGVVGKVYFINNKKRSTMISLGAEMFFQFWASLFFAVVAAGFFFKDIHLIYRIIVVCFIALLPFLITFIKHIIKHESMASYLNQYFKYAPSIIFRSSVIMLLTIMQYYVVINHFQSISIANSFIVAPLILSANLIPITYAGLGLRETFAVAVLTHYAISPETAVTSSLTVFSFTTVLTAIVGIFFLITARKKN